MNRQLVIGCGPTGPMCDASAIANNATVLDVAIPHSLKGRPSKGISVFMGETLVMPKQWKRGFWGPFYHLVSGYGWGTILACVIEPLAVVSSGRNKPYALGQLCSRCMDFGQEAQRLGFEPVVRTAPLLS